MIICTKPFLLKRCIACLIDYVIIYMFFFVFTMKLGEPVANYSYEITGPLALIPIFFWFFMTVLLEVYFGATIGNSIVGLKPKSLLRTSGILSFGQSFKRHLLDPIDMFLFGFIGIILIKNTDKNQRLGDVWAKTIVVETNVRP